MASCLQEVVNEPAPALAHRNPFGFAHNTEEATQAAHELELWERLWVDDSDLEPEEQGPIA